MLTFFCAAGLYKPHLPWYVPQRFFDLYPLDTIQLPLVRDDDLDAVPEIPRNWVNATSDHKTILKHGQWHHAVQGYLAAVSYCDSLVGRIWKALKTSPAADNTIVVLLGDNGFHLGEKLHWRKFVLWEEAPSVPLIICQPAAAERVRQADTPVSLTDVFPTLCELVGISSLPDIDGISPAPIIRGDQLERELPVVSTWQEGNHSLPAGLVALYALPRRQRGTL